MRHDRGLALAVALACVFVLLASARFHTYVMPQLHEEGLPLAERLRSGVFGDSYGYARYAEGILEHGALRTPEGAPILKHVPGLPLLVAGCVALFGSVRPLLALQVVLFFVSLYFLLARVGSAFPRAAVLATVATLAVHPAMIKHSAAVMSDLLFGAVLLQVACVLWNAPPAPRRFALAGLLFGLAAYLRESALPLLLATAAACALRSRRYRVPVAAMLGAFLLVLAPWVARNALVTERLVPLTTKGVELLYYSSLPLTRDVYDPLGPGLQERGYDYARLYQVYHREVRGLRGDGVPREPDAETLKALYDPWRERWLPRDPVRAALANYLERPAEQLRSLALKNAAFFSKPAILAWASGTRFAEALVAANVLFWGFHLGVILFGLCLAFRPARNPFFFVPWWIGALYLQALLLWSEERYLLPVYPFLLLLAYSWYAGRWSPRRGSELAASRT